MTLQSITDTVRIGETIMHWHGGKPILSKVVAKGFFKGKHSLIVLVDNKEIHVTEIV